MSDTAIVGILFVAYFAVSFGFSIYNRCSPWGLVVEDTPDLCALTWPIQVIIMVTDSTSFRGPYARVCDWIAGRVCPDD